MPLLNVEEAVPVCAKFKTERPPENVDVAETLVTLTCGVVSTPVAATDVVPVCPTAKRFARRLEKKPPVEVAFVVVALFAVNPPLNAICVVVALFENGNAKFA